MTGAFKSSENVMARVVSAIPYAGIMASFLKPKTESLSMNSDMILTEMGSAPLTIAFK